MSLVTIKLAPQEVSTEFYFSKNRIGLVRSVLDLYTAAKPFFTDLEGTKAAEEAFDLTNNPYRQSERVELYGRGRSLSIGDIVEVCSNGETTEFLCDSFGWIKL